MTTPPVPPPTPTEPPTPTPTFWQRLNAFGQQHYLKAAGAVGLAVLAVVVPGALGAVKGLFDSKPPSCPGRACEGRLPGNCAADALAYEPKQGNPARLQVRYSPRCGAAWGKILAGQGGDTVSVSSGDADPQEAKINYGTDQFTRMVYVGKQFRVKVCARPSDVAATQPWHAYCVEADQDALR